MKTFFTLLTALVVGTIYYESLISTACVQAALPPALEPGAIATSDSKLTKPIPAKKRQDESSPKEEIVLLGIASWYSERDPYINKHTANGEVFDDSKLTCASWEFPFNTVVKVTNLSNGKSITCRINDRGPSKRLNRLIDLTKETFGRIANLKLGLIQV
ncbi:MAG TPA: septal ring lytic transglycosylase RlpA family protein, partial [bacterium]|nr:septal ring lytic transglycosylase RlpA family protein [bacterium]